MGCDIHLAIQRFEYGDWDMWTNRVFVSRNYCLFAHMAGVRNYDNFIPVAKPRGLPDGNRDFWRDDYLGEHSFSWLSREELREAIARAEKVIREDGYDGPCLIEIKAVLAAMDALEGETRVVFGFDN